MIIVTMITATPSIGRYNEKHDCENAMTGPEQQEQQTLNDDDKKHVDMTISINSSRQAS